MTKKTIYIAGPMRGLPRFNFDSFDAAEKALIEQGWTVISPATLDREAGHDPDKLTEKDITPEFLHACIERDVAAVLKSDAIALLPGWEKSKGAKAELVLAQWAQKEVFVYPEMTPLGVEDILTEALRITGGDRQAQYGPPDQDFVRIAGAWHSLFGWDVQSWQVAAAQIVVKLSRQSHQRKRDNWVDVAGYARCGQICDEAAAKRG